MKKSVLFAAVLAAGATGVSAAVLTQIPVQDYGDNTSSWMLMPMVSYSANNDSVQVMMPNGVPQLTPLLVSNPSDGFDPGDPWFDALDPTVQGASFSQRYGFMMSGNSDAVPSNRQLWIRKLSGSTDLKFYRYSSSAPKSFEPIFGTDGSTNALAWSLLMFHPVVTAPPGTNSYTATFEVYVVDTNTGEEVPGSSSGPLAFNWTDVSDGRPSLSLAPKSLLSGRKPRQQTGCWNPHPLPTRQPGQPSQISRFN